MKAGKVVSLLFVGMLIGIILFVGVIVGVPCILGSVYTVGEVQNMIGMEIIDPTSEIFDKTLLDTVKLIIDDVSNPSNLSLSTLGDKYGLKLISNFAGIDLTTKDFYTAPLDQLIANPGMIVESLTLQDIGNVANIDFGSYGLPILTDNLNESVTVAIDNLLSSINGETLSIRSIKNTLGIDLGVGDNALLASLQDLNLSSFGNVINLLELNTLLEADTDKFVPSGRNLVYAKVDVYEEVSSSDLTNGEVSVGIESFIAGVKGDVINMKEMRYVKKNVDGIDTYVVDNSCYSESFDVASNEKTFYRHIQYAPITSEYAQSGTELYIYSYVNRIETYGGSNFTLKSGDFISLDTIYLSNSKSDSYQKAILSNPTVMLDANGRVNIELFYIEDKTLETPQLVTESAFSITDATITKDSLLHPVLTTTRDKYARVHIGTSQGVVKAVAHLSVKDLQNADGLINNLTIGDIIDINSSSTSLMQALKDSTLSSIGDDVNNLTFGEIMGIGDDSSSLMKALKDSTINTVESDIETFTLGDILDINDSSSTLMKSLKDSTLNTIDNDINNLTIDQIIDVTSDDTSAIMKSLAARGCTIDGLGSIANELSIGEVLVIDYDQYQESATGFYVKSDLYVKYNEYVHDGYTIYKKVGSSYEVAEEDYAGEKFVNVGRYSVYDASLHLGHTRYDLTHQGTSSKAIQSLALRGTPLKELGAVMDSLFIDELLSIDNASSLVMKSLSKHDKIMNELGTSIDDLRIDEVIEINASSSHIMKSLANRGTKISELGTVMDDMTIDEIIEIDTSSALIMQSLATRGTKINELGTVMDTLRIDEIIDVNDPSTSVIMKSLASRGCTINDLGSIADKLTLAELMTIKTDDYTKNDNGLYVRIDDTTLVVPVNESLSYMADMPRFDKDGNAQDDGTYTYSHYFTLYNPADPTHASVQRYDLHHVSDSDSKMLQRFAFTTLKSDSFNSFTLCDLIDIDADLYQAVDDAYVSAHPDADYYSYDSASHIFVHWDGISDCQLYIVSKEGSSNTLLKRMTFCKVNDLATSIDTIIENTRINELIDINTHNAIAISDATATPDSSSRYLIYPVGTDEDGRYYTYVYDSTGKYMVRDYRMQETPSSELTISDTEYYRYVAVPTSMSTAELALLVSSQNVYYLTSEGEYVYNFPLVANILAKGTTNSSGIYTNSYYSGKLFTRKSCSSTDSGAIAANTYSNANLYVSILGSYVPYNSGSITHLSHNTYFIKVDEKSIVPISARGYSYYDGVTLKYDTSYDYVDGNVTIAKRYCDKVYVKSETGAYVYFNGKYVLYNDSIHSGLQRYDEKIAYLATYAESYYLSSGVEYTDFTLISVTEVEREQSAPVLRYFARNDSTISNFNNIIEDATIKDLMDIDPNSIFAKFQDSKISQLNSALSDAFSTFTIGELVEWASITDIDSQVIDAVGNVTLTNFFKSLKFSASSGIYIDMEVALGYN